MDAGHAREAIALPGGPFVLNQDVVLRTDFGADATAGAVLFSQKRLIVPGQLKQRVNQFTFNRGNCPRRTSHTC